MSRFVVDANNLWLTAITDGTVMVREGPFVPDLNTHDPQKMLSWKQVARIGSNRHCTHRELEVFGVVFSGPKLEELRKGILGNQRTVNREGFSVAWFNPSGGSTLARANSRLRRLNDLYDWSKHGVQVPLPVQTEWDRFELATGKLMVGASGEGGGSAEMKKELEEKEKENQRLQAEKDKEIEELKKQAKEKEDAAKEKEDAANKENEELKKQAKERDDAAKKENDELKKQVKERDDQIAAKDKTIGNLRNALASFT